MSPLQRMCGEYNRAVRGESRPKRRGRLPTLGVDSPEAARHAPEGGVVAAIWIVSEESALPATLAHHVRSLGDVWLGVPERAAFKDAPSPDLLIR